MKRPKKAVPIQEVIEQTITSLKCPHCHTEMHGLGGGKSLLRMSCWHCQNPIDLDWENISKN